MEFSASLRSVRSDGSSRSTRMRNRNGRSVSYGLCSSDSIAVDGEKDTTTNACTGASGRDQAGLPLLSCSGVSTHGAISACAADNGDALGDGRFLRSGGTDSSSGRRRREKFMQAFRSSKSYADDMDNDDDDEDDGEGNSSDDNDEDCRSDVLSLAWSSASSSTSPKMLSSLVVGGDVGGEIKDREDANYAGTSTPPRRFLRRSRPGSYPPPTVPNGKNRGGGGGTSSSSGGDKRKRRTSTTSQQGEEYVQQTRHALQATFQRLSASGVSVTPLDDVPYVHGGYAAAAPLMLDDEVWREGVLKRLLPQSYDAALRLLDSSNGSGSTGASFSSSKKKTETETKGEDASSSTWTSSGCDPVKLMKWAENNPVVAAYGVLQGLPRRSREQAPSACWTSSGSSDAGADGGWNSSVSAGVVSSNVAGLSEYSSSVGGGTTRRRNSSASSSGVMGRPTQPPPPSTTKSRVRSREPNTTAIEWDVFLDPHLVKRVDMAMDAASKVDDDVQERMVAEIEVDRQVGRLLQRMLLAHGSTSQLVTEALGVAPRYNFAKVAETTLKVVSGARARRRKDGRSDSSSARRGIGGGCGAGDSSSTSKTNTSSSSSSSTSAPSSGMFMEQWLFLFNRAVRLGHKLTVPQNRSYGGRKKEDVSSTTVLGTSLTNRRRNFVLATATTTVPPSKRVISAPPGPADMPGWEYEFDMGANRGWTGDRSGSTNANRSGDRLDGGFGDVDGGDNSILSGEHDDEEEESDPSSPDMVKVPLCGLFLCLGMSDPNSERADHGRSCMASTLRSINEFLGVPLRVVLDLKSRFVPPRVWGRVIDHLRQRGLCVKGIGSFDIKELRAVANCCSTPVTQIIFFHSAGDLQRACHADEIERGDTVYFNAGSLLWQKPTLMEAADIQCCAPSTETHKHVDGQSSRYVVQPFAHPRSSLDVLPSELSSISTLEDYQKKYGLQIGVYVQEFSICEEALEVLVNFLNFHRSVYRLGMAWGGLNGAIVQGVTGDGYWNQRFMGRNWDLYTGPNDTLEMVGEDHGLVREALLTVACAQAGTVNDDEVKEISNAIQTGPCAPGHGANDQFLDARKASNFFKHARASLPTRKSY